VLQFGRQAYERLRAVVEAVVLTHVDAQLGIELRGGLAGIPRFAGPEDQVADIDQKHAIKNQHVGWGLTDDTRRPSSDFVLHQEDKRSFHLDFLAARMTASNSPALYVALDHGLEPTGWFIPLAADSLGAVDDGGDLAARGAGLGAVQRDDGIAELLAIDRAGLSDGRAVAGALDEVRDARQRLQSRREARQSVEHKADVDGRN